MPRSAGHSGRPVPPDPGTPGRRARRASVDVIIDTVRGVPPSRVDWLDVVALANAHLVAPRVHAAIEAFGLAPFVDDDALEYLALVSEANARRNGRLLDQARNALAALNAEGVTPLLLKGAAELVRGTAAARSRMLTDIDMLVGEGEAERAVAALRCIGYALIANSGCAHSPGSFAAEGVVGAIDLHHRLPADYSDVLTGAEALRRAELRSWDGLSVRLPDAETRLIVATGHELLQDRGILRGTLELRELLDCHDVMATSAAALDVGRLQQRCAGTPMRLALEVQLLTLESLFDIEVRFGETPSRRAFFLRDRRLFRARHPRIARVEWAVLRRIDRAFTRSRPQPRAPAARPDPSGEAPPTDRVNPVERARGVT